LRTRRTTASLHNVVAATSRAGDFLITGHSTLL
jgi:hypothetical protein